MAPPDDPFLRYAPTLAAALLALVFNLLVSALIGGSMPLEYTGRATVFTALMLYVLAGAVVLFRKVAAAESGPLSAARVLRWAVSMWFWPLLLLRR